MSNSENKRTKCVHVDCDRTCKYVEATKQPCECGHSYDDHTRTLDSPTKRQPCKVCYCQAYKDVTTKAKYQKQVEDAIQATSPKEQELIEIPYIETRFKPEKPKLIFEDRFDAHTTWICENDIFCGAKLIVPQKIDPCVIKCPLCHRTMCPVAQIVK